MIGYYLFLVFEKIVMILPRFMRKALFIGLANFAYLIDKKHRRVILQNLHFAMGQSCTAQEEEQISRYCYHNLLLNLLQIIENRTISKEEIGNRVTIENLAIVDAAKATGRPIIFTTAHFGNWELGGATISTQIMPIHVAHKALKNPYFEQYLHQARSRLDMNLVEKRGAVKQLAKALKAGEAISLLTDQNTSERDGIIVNFFGKTARQTAAPAFLARKYDALILPVYISTEDEEHYTLRFYEAIEVSKTDDAKADILEATQKQANLLELVIAENPKFWFWCHRRWKTEHPEIYR
ncbi:MAG: lipid A biosynthesis lauroyl acyltransferase [Campylobacterota bacterium]|nr:lipid A biosynthesis lauroyl acyltransferase [Campylobacterota bacterium]